VPKSERDKGKRGELEVAHVFTDAGLPADRTAQLQAGGQCEAADVRVRPVPSLFVEVKRRESYELGKWERQIEADAPSGSVPLIAYRKSRQPWRAIVRLDWLAARLAELVRLRAEVEALRNAYEATGFPWPASLRALGYPTGEGERV
jgi:Holliday junction resolvase